MSFLKKLIKQLIKETKPTNAKNVEETLKEIFTRTLKEMLEAELDEHLGYSKYDYKNKIPQTVKMVVLLKKYYLT